MEIQLPESEGLDIQDLKCIFDKKSECYKLFWFKAILKKVKEGQQDITYNELVCLMMADAYYMVNEYHLNLGPNDSLEKIVKIIAQQTEVKPSEKVEKIYDMLLDYSNKEITTLKSNLIKNVPYCLQSHFLQGTTIAQLSSKREEKIRELNQQHRLLYYYGTYQQYDTKIMITDAWFLYLSKNLEILEGWVQYNLIKYLQRRNPTIPGIPNKIAPPKKRDLTEAKAFWRAVITKIEIEDCYTGHILNEEGIEKFGKIEIDHFIPWAFVANDEIWNLVPTFKNVNLSKSNFLPDMEKDLQKMAYEHNKAFRVAETDSRIKKLLKKYLEKNLNDMTVKMDLYTNHIEEKQYEKGISKIIEPIYLSAQNAGYKEWINRIEV